MQVGKTLIDPEVFLNSHIEPSGDSLMRINRRSACVAQPEV